MTRTWLQKLAASAAKPTRVIAGVMSGTSMDAIDVALCRITGAGRGDDGTDAATVGLVSFHQAPYPAGPAARLRRIEALTVRDVAELHVLVGEAFADACLGAFRQAGVRAEDVDLIGSHGQTIYHHSAVPGAIKSTLQIGDADVIAARTGVGAIGDFRARDIALGGEGAPLTPYTDVILYRLDQHPGRAVLNLGGIANITFLGDGPARDVFGFDTGPANAPLDRLARLLSQGTLSYDRDGAFAQAGRVEGAMLRFLLEDDYLRAPPPKSTGFERYGDDFVTGLVARHGPPSPDTLATVTEFVAQSVADALRRHVRPRAAVTEIVLAGGGARNPELRRRLQDAIAPVALLDSDALGVPAQAREAMAFALLANDALRGLPTSLPSVTGARRAAVLGKLSFPAQALPSDG